MATYYVDTASSGGDGTTQAASGANAAFATIAAMQAKAGGYSAGDSILLKRGCVWREAFTFPSSGSEGSPITLGAYGTGNKPILKGSDLFATFTSYSGTTYQAAATTQVYQLWRDGAYVPISAGNKDTLANGEWTWASNVLYVRDDANDLTNAGYFSTHTIEGAIRAYCVRNNTTNYVTVDAVKLMHETANGTSNAGIYANGGTGVTVFECESEEAGLVSANNSAGLVVARCRLGAARNTNTGQIYLAGTTTSTIRHNRFGRTVRSYFPINIAGTGTHLIAHNLFTAYGRVGYGANAAVNSTATAGTVTVTNNILPGSVAESGYGTLRNNSTGTMVANRNILLPDAFTPTLLTAGTVTEGTGANANINLGPRWTQHAHTGYSLFLVDDTAGCGVAADILAVAQQYGYTFGLAVNSVTGVTAVAITAIQAFIDAGGWIANHTATHADVSVLTGITLRYVGTGSAAMVTISSNTLTTTVTGGPGGENLNVDLTNASYNTLYKLSSYLDGLAAYTCSVTTANVNANTASTSLADVTGQDIKTAGLALALDETRYYTYEITSAHTWIAATFTEADGVTPYTPTVFVYPYGTTVPANAVTWLRGLGYVSARSSISISGHAQRWATRDGIDLFALPATATKEYGLIGQFFESQSQNANDASGWAKNLTATDLTYSNTAGNYSPILNGSAYGAVFNGTSSYATRTDATFDWHRGDGFITAWLKPTALNVEQTIFWQSTDDSNYHRLYIDASGNLVYKVVASGAEAVSVSAAGLLSTSEIRRVSLCFWDGKYVLYGGTAEAARTTSTAKPAAYSGGVVIGRSGSSTPGAYYGGVMSGLCYGVETYMRATALFLAAAEAGGVTSTYTHLEGMPSPMYRLIFEAAQDSGAADLSKTYPQVATELRANGTLGADNRTLTWVQTDASDYRLRSNSPGIDVGVDLGLTPDFAGSVVPQGSAPDLGPYEYLAATFKPVWAVRSRRVIGGGVM